MDDNELNIKELIDKYEQMRYMGKSIYFDSDEFAVLADYYYDFGDYLEADNIAETGLEMHPGNTQLMIIKAKTLVFNQKFQEAFDYLAGVSEDEGNVDYLLVKIETLLYLHKLEQANEILERVLKTGELSDEELKERMRTVRKPDHPAPGVLAGYRAGVSGAEEGALWLYR